MSYYNEQKHPASLENKGTQASVSKKAKNRYCRKSVVKVSLTFRADMLIYFLSSERGADPRERKSHDTGKGEPRLFSFIR